MSSSESNSSSEPQPRNNRRTVNYQKISLEKKNLLIKLFEEGETVQNAANIAGLNINSAKTVLRRYRQNECELLIKKKGGNRPTKLTAEVLTKIERIVETNPGFTLAIIKQKLAEQNLPLSLSSIQNGLSKLRITLKLASLEMESMNSPRTIALRKEYAMQFSTWAQQNREKLIFIDESGFNLHLRRRHAKSKKNTPARIILPSVRGRNFTLIAGLTDQGIIHHKIISNSTCNGSKFCGFLSELISKLDGTNYYFIMDNAQIHKTSEVKELIETSQNHIQFLPPYSPMLNPIEKAFSKIKSKARDLLVSVIDQNLVDVITRSVNSVTATDCSNFILDMMMTLPSAAAGETLT